MPQAVVGNGTVRSANGAKPVRGGPTVTPAKAAGAPAKSDASTVASNGSGAARRERSAETASPASSGAEPPVEETTH